MNTENLRNLIEQKGKSQREIANELGISSQRFNNYVTGIREPDVENLTLLSKYFGVSIDYLAGNIDPTVLDTAEYPVMTKYRALDDHGREAVNSMLDELFAIQKNTPTAYSDERMNVVLQNSDEMRQLFQTMSQLKPESIQEIIRFVRFQKSLQEPVGE